MKSLIVLSLVVLVVDSFHHVVNRVPSSTSVRCICVNCKYVTDCTAYHFVEEKHRQPHISANPTFEPRDGSPTINVHMRPIIGREDEENRMLQEHKDEEKRAMSNGSGALIGEKVYDMRPEMSLEYDVVECADFIEDKGCWVRNMPEAIRLANPTFVPP